MNVAVLGKGLSLNNYVELPDVDHYIIVNNFDWEILQNEKLKHDLFIKSTTAWSFTILTELTFEFNLKLMPCFLRIFKNSFEISLSIPGII